MDFTSKDKEKTICINNLVEIFTQELKQAEKEEILTKEKIQEYAEATKKCVPASFNNTFDFLNKHKVGSRFPLGTLIHNFHETVTNTAKILEIEPRNLAIEVGKKIDKSKNKTLIKLREGLGIQNQTLNTLSNF